VDNAQNRDRRTVDCPICESDRYTVLYEPVLKINDPNKLYGAASGLPGTQRIVVCMDCGMIYENPRYPKDVIISAYVGSQEEDHDSQYSMRVKSFLNVLKRNEAFLPPKGAKVLDIGTAGGAFLQAAEEFGYEAYGLEPSEYLVEAGRRRGLKVIQGTTDDLKHEPVCYDLVTLWDVIEHLTDPKSALVDIRRLLNSGGTLLMNYPDIGTWMARLARQRFWWILSVHLHHFTQQSIRNMCIRSGFEVIQFSPYFQTLQLGYLIQIAAKLNVPAAQLSFNLLPRFFRQIPIPYYASQTTALLRVR
jgi:SAM-dependent methyltransferase